MVRSRESERKRVVLSLGVAFRRRPVNTLHVSPRGKVFASAHQQGRGIRPPHTHTPPRLSAGCEMAALVGNYRTQLSVISGHVSWSALPSMLCPQRGSLCCHSPVVLSESLSPGNSANRTVPLRSLQEACLISGLCVPRLCHHCSGWDQSILRGS